MVKSENFWSYWTTKKEASYAHLVKTVAEKDFTAHEQRSDIYIIAEGQVSYS